MALPGARQVGKTTLAAQVVAAWDGPTVREDLGLEHLWVVYPGDLEYPLGNAITALPLKRIHGVAFG